MLLKIIDCDHGDFSPEQKVADKEGVRLEIGQVTHPDEIIAFAKDADAILVQRASIDRRIMAALPKCKVIGRYGSGVDSVDAQAARDLGVKVVYTPYFCFPEVANHTLGFILALTRRIPMVSLTWKSDPARFNREYDERLKLIRGVRRPTEQTLGIVGFGKIGAEVARRARVFGYTVKAYDPYVSGQWMRSQGVEKVATIDELLPQVDILTFHCPLTPETHGMVGSTQLSRMRKGACLVNAARGPIVQEKALVAALKSGHLAGAALDVQEVEPLPEASELFGLDNVLLTPHVAFYSDESFHDLKDRIARYTINAWRGQGEYEALL